MVGGLSVQLPNQLEEGASWGINTGKRGFYILYIFLHFIKRRFVMAAGVYVEWSLFYGEAIV